MSHNSKCISLYQQGFVVQFIRAITQSTGHTGALTLLVSPAYKYHFFHCKHVTQTRLFREGGGGVLSPAPRALRDAEWIDPPCSPFFFCVFVIVGYLHLLFKGSSSHHFTYTFTCSVTLHSSPLWPFMHPSPPVNKAGQNIRTEY